MSTETNKSIVRSVYETIDGAQGMGPIAQFIAPGFKQYTSISPEPVDLAGFQQFGNAFFAALSGLRHNIDDLFGEGDRVVVRLHATGRHTGPLVMPQGEIPATGKELTINALNIMRLVDGNIAEMWLEMDAAGLLQQLGLIPAPEQVPA